MSPVENFAYQQATYALQTVCGGRPHGDKLRACRVTLVKKGAGNAACSFAVDRQKSDTSVAIHPFYACQPLSVGKPRLLGEGRTERMRGILQRTKANSLKDRSILRRDSTDRDQAGHLPFSKLPRAKHMPESMISAPVLLRERLRESRQERAAAGGAFNVPGSDCCVPGQLEQYC